MEEELGGDPPQRLGIRQQGEGLRADGQGSPRRQHFLEFRQQGFQRRPAVYGGVVRRGWLQPGGGLSGPFRGLAQRAFRGIRAQAVHRGGQGQQRIRAQPPAFLVACGTPGAAAPQDQGSRRGISDPEEGHPAVEGGGFDGHLPEGAVLAHLGGRHRGASELQELAPDRLPDRRITALEEGVQGIAPQAEPGQAHELAEGAVGFQDAALVVHQPHGLAGIEAQGQAREIRWAGLLHERKGHPQPLASALHPGTLLPQPLQLLEGHEAQEQAAEDRGGPGQVWQVTRQQHLGQGAHAQRGGADQGHPQLQLAPAGPAVGQVRKDQPEQGLQGCAAPEAEDLLPGKMQAQKEQAQEQAGAAHTHDEVADPLDALPLGLKKNREAKEGPAELSRGHRKPREMGPGQGQYREDAAEKVAVAEAQPPLPAEDPEAQPGRQG